MKKLTLPLVVTTCALLTACGSDEPATVIIQQPTPTQETATTPAATPTTTESASANQGSVDALKADIDAIKKQLEEAKASGANADAIKKAEEKLKETESKLETANKQITETKTSEEKAKADLTKLQNELGQTERDLKKSKEDAEAASKKAKEDANKLQENIDTLKKELEEAKAKGVTDDVKAVQDKLDKANEDLKAANTKLEAANTALENAKKAENDAKDRAADLQAEIDKLKKQLEDKNNNNPPAQAQDISIASALDSIAKDIKELDNYSDYGGLLIAIDNTKKTATGTTLKYANDKDISAGFSNFSLDGVDIKLLGSPNRANVGIRQLTADDFNSPSSFKPKDANNPGFIGNYASTYGAFGAMRYGVYTDQENKTHLFTYGDVSNLSKLRENVVDKGLKTFKGNVIMGKDGNYRALDKALTLEVDDALTKVDVKIETGKETLRFGGQIKANDIQKSVAFGGTQNGVRTEGIFYGAGSEVGGAFEVLEGTHKGENGVYAGSNSASMTSRYGY